MKSSWLMTTTILVVILMTTAIYFSMRHSTEAGFQSNKLIAIQKTKDDQIDSIHILHRWAKPESALTLTSPKDIRQLMAVIRDDLRVSNREINPNGDDRPPMYDTVLIKLNKGGTLPLYCWIGKEGGENPSLAIRSKRGEFKRTIQEIMKQQFKPTTPLEVRDERVTVRMSRMGSTNEFQLTAQYAGKLNGTWFILAAADLFDAHGKEVRARKVGTGRFHWKEDDDSEKSHFGDSRRDNPLRETLVLDMQGLAPGKYRARPSVDIFYEKKDAHLHLTNRPEGIRPGKVVDILFTIN